MKIGGCKTGQAKKTKVYRLPCYYVIHTVGPKWRGGKHGERELLKSCYYESLKIADKNNFSTIAFPLISAGVYGYPREEALQIATETINSFIKDKDMIVYLVLFEK